MGEIDGGERKTCIARIALLIIIIIVMIVIHTLQHSQMRSRWSGFASRRRKHAPALDEIYSQKSGIQAERARGRGRSGEVDRAKVGCSNFRYPATAQEIKYEFDNYTREKARRQRE